LKTKMTGGIIRSTTTEQPRKGMIKKILTGTTTETGKMTTQMKSGRGRTAMSKVDVLKIDKDCHVDQSWILDYVRVVRCICHMKRVNVASVEVSHSKKGLHFYIGIQSRVSSELANRLQWLLGDDCRRVDYNRARIRSHYPDWNKLLERIGQRFLTLSFQGSCRNTKNQERRDKSN